jgi:hypothetical protein
VYFRERDEHGRVKVEMDQGDPLPASPLENFRRYLFFIGVTDDSDVRRLFAAGEARLAAAAAEPVT